MGRIRVLVAARRSAVIDSVCREMESGERCAFELAANGRQAVEAALRAAPDILVADAVLEEMDGLAVVDRLQAALGERMPQVIGGALEPMGEAGFLRRGAAAVVRVPWRREELRAALCGLIAQRRTRIDWARARAGYDRACALLTQMGMNGALKGYAYLAWAAALAYEDEDRLHAVGRDLYGPIAARFGATEQSVERLIRHAVESAMDSVGARGVYGFFGNTIDPTRGKPTNAQMIAMLVQRLRIR